MELPIRLRDAISHQLQERNQAALMRSAQELSLRYRAGNARGQRLVTTRDEALSYCITRMPATYGAVYSCLNSILEQTGLRQVSLLDAGAGTGAASWAAAQLLSLKSIVCLEREEALLALGKTLMSGMPESFMHTTWLRQDITHKDFSQRQIWSSPLIIQ
jgi:ribosomal protein RSM22 (predicted rRNA methylase)